MRRPLHKDPHEISIINLGKVLIRDNPADDIRANSAIPRKKKTVPGTNIYPDVINFTKKIAYEVHWKGNRKEEQFDNIPEGWRGVNVFIVGKRESEDVYVLDLNNNYAHIMDQDWQKVPMKVQRQR